MPSNVLSKYERLPPYRQTDLINKKIADLNKEIKYEKNPDRLKELYKEKFKLNGLSRKVLASDTMAKHEAACILIEALNTLLNE